MDPAQMDAMNPITGNPFVGMNANPMLYVDANGRISFLSSAEEYTASVLKSYDHQIDGAAKARNSDGAFALGFGWGLASVGNMVVGGLNTTSNLLAQNFYGDDTYTQAAREIGQNEATMSQAIESSVNLVDRTSGDPFSAMVTAAIAMNEFQARLDRKDPLANATMGKLLGQMAVPMGGAEAGIGSAAARVGAAEARVSAIASVVTKLETGTFVAREGAGGASELRMRLNPENDFGAFEGGDRLMDFNRSQIDHVPTSGAKLVATPGRTTTIIGSFRTDMEKIIEMLGNYKNEYFGPRPGGFNVLNVPDETFNRAGNNFMKTHNFPWLREAMERNDIFKVVSAPVFKENSVLFKTVRQADGTIKREITGYGQEYLEMRRNGYSYDSAKGEMVRASN